MFECIICHDVYEDEEMSDEENICIYCEDEEDITTLIALDII